jgi:predicted secreted protein
MDDFIKSAEKLYITTSNNSGGIEELWKQNAELKIMVEANSKASKIINEITTTWKIGKTVVSFVISFLLLLVAIKSIINGGIKDGLNAIRNLI